MIPKSTTTKAFGIYKKTSEALAAAGEAHSWHGGMRQRSTPSTASMIDTVRREQIVKALEELLANAKAKCAEIDAAALSSACDKLRDF